MGGKQSKIRVLQVLDKCAIRGSPIHGVSRLLLSWWPAFDETDIELSLCVLRGGHGTCSAFEDMGIDVRDLSRSKIDPRTIADLLGMIKRDRIQILHCHGYGATTFGRIAGVLAGIPVVVQEHMVDKSIPGYQKLADRMLSRLTGKGIAVSHAVERFMIEYRSIPESRMTVVYNTIPNEYCREVTPVEKEAVIAKYRIPVGVPLVGILGRLDPIKGQDIFIQAARIVHDQSADVHFLIIGDGHFRRQLEDMVSEANLDGFVHFLGHCHDALPLIALLDVFVSSSRSEGFGIVNAEAMAQKKAVVAAEVDGVSEIVEDGVSGLLVPPENAEKLAAEILAVLADSSLKKSLGEKAYARVRELFLVDKTVKELGQIYRELLEQR